MSNGQWTSGVSPEDIEARFYVRWLTKTKKEIHHYTNHGSLSTSTELPAWDDPQLLAHAPPLTLGLIGNGEWSNGLMEIRGLHGAGSSPGTQQLLELGPSTMFGIPQWRFVSNGCGITDNSTWI